MIDGNIANPWPPEVVSGLSGLTQGTVVTRPPFFYWGTPSASLYALTERPITDDDPVPADGEIVEILEEDRPPYGIITTQTCDIQDGARPKKPWVQLAPVYRASEDLPLTRLQAGRYTTYLFWIPEIPEEGTWIADLRLQLPVEKGWLVTRADTSFDGFSNDAQRIAFAERLATNCQRPAVADRVMDHIVKPLQKALDRLGRDSGERERVLDPVEEFAFRFEGDRIAPETVQLVGLSHEPVEEDIQRWYQEWWAAHVAESTVGDVVLPPVFERFDELSATDYRRLMVLDWGHLSPVDEV